MATRLDKFVQSQVVDWRDTCQKYVQPTTHPEPKKRMALSSKDLLSIVKPHLTDAELANAVVYGAEGCVPAKANFNFHGVAIEAPHQAHLFFVDREPMANWGHSCRYVLISCKTEEARSFEGRFPPPENGFRWHIIYRAPPVTDLPG